MRKTNHSEADIALAEQIPVKVRTGRFRGRIGRVQYTRTVAGRALAYVRVGPSQGRWIPSRSIELMA